MSYILEITGGSVKHHFGYALDENGNRIYNTNTENQERVVEVDKPILTHAVDSFDISVKKHGKRVNGNHTGLYDVDITFYQGEKEKAVTSVRMSAEMFYELCAAVSETQGNNAISFLS